MHNFAPTGYVCPICKGVAGVEDESTLIRQSDIVYQDELVMAFITSFFIGKCPGHLVIVPKQHFENLFDMPPGYGDRIYEVSQKMAIAMKEAYGCEGVMTLQNNGPASGQHAFHYHLHLFPRYKDDNLHADMGNKQPTTAEDRLPFAEKMRAALQGAPDTDFLWLSVCGEENDLYGLELFNDSEPVTKWTSYGSQASATAKTLLTLIRDVEPGEKFSSADLRAKVAKRFGDTSISGGIQYAGRLRLINTIRRGKHHRTHIRVVDDSIPALYGGKN
ncbi:MAG TPA: HIT family protein [Verrucomicrobiae bacterium]|nr:HIT family protein [Verrucomicrobiae bacterium]